MKARLPKRVWAIRNGEDGGILSWYTTRKAALKELREYNELDGYDPDCTLVEYMLRGEAVP
jgi:hypothetical protein